MEKLTKIMNEGWGLMSRKDLDIKIVASEDGDWYGLYIHGELKCEDHSLSYRHVLRALNLEFDTLTLNEEQFNVFGSRCPKFFMEAEAVKNKVKKIERNPNDPFNEEDWQD